jgi:hypothetical protein
VHWGHGLPVKKVTNLPFSSVRQTCKIIKRLRKNGLSDKHRHLWNAILSNRIFYLPYFANNVVVKKLTKAFEDKLMNIVEKEWNFQKM